MKRKLLLLLSLLLVSCQNKNVYVHQKHVNGKSILNKKNKQFKSEKRANQKITIRNKEYKLEIKDSVLCLVSNENNYSLFPIYEEANTKEIHYVDFISLINGSTKLSNNVFSFHKDSVIVNQGQEVKIKEYLHKEKAKYSITIIQSYLVDYEYNVLEYKKQFLLKGIVLLEESYSLLDSILKSSTNGCQDATNVILDNLYLDNSESQKQKLVQFLDEHDYYCEYVLFHIDKLDGHIGSKSSEFSRKLNSVY